MEIDTCRRSTQLEKVNVITIQIEYASDAR